MTDTIVLDIEIQNDPTLPEFGWDATDRLGVSCCCLFEYRTNQFRVYGPDQLDALKIRLDAADNIIGFNVLDFDLPVIMGLSKSTWAECERSTWVVYTTDILQDIWSALGGRFYKGWNLDTVAGCTLGRRKTGNGAEAPNLYQAGRWPELIDYCLTDVALTRDLYDFIEAHGFCVGGVPERILRFAKAKEAA